MTKYREIIRLAGLNLSQTNIALSCSVSKTTVNKVLKAAKEKNIAWLIIPAFESHRIRYAEPPNPSGGAMRNQIPFRCSEPYPTMNLRQLCRTH